MASSPKPKDRGSDMTSTLEEHRLTTQELLAKGEEALTQGKLLRASETFWESRHSRGQSPFNSLGLRNGSVTCGY